MKGEAAGLIHIYVDKCSQVIKGAELCAPEGEHLAHLLAWIIDRPTTLEEALHLPFYHPSVE